MKALKIIAVALAFFLGFAAVGALVEYNDQRAVDIKVDKITETFEYDTSVLMKPCVDEATKGGTVDIATAQAYCRCVIEDAKDYFGSSFNKELEKVDSNGFTTEWNEIINGCLADYL